MPVFESALPREDGKYNRPWPAIRPCTSADPWAGNPLPHLFLHSAFCTLTCFVLTPSWPFADGFLRHWDRMMVPSAPRLGDMAQALQRPAKRAVPLAMGSRRVPRLLWVVVMDCLVRLLGHAQAL
ncbi:predicted protein [Plenodomus lingam JN3]|uniref:Predicted protein n=1 Tax=Leptosphaeria maculans (strain JN3 / isolate v23.1.3 / race Av1-4-5-6-7-8) TaxID=985895 RepID=E5A359_LEPMJ|nr:predicted protein [Plenodomus lingam JN3]CBX98072.1 predicted protein [Plenodomus lingam JN3]